MLHSWRLSLISLYVAAYAWNKPVNSTCPSRNLQRVHLLAWALLSSFSQLAAFPFTLGDFWTTCPILTVEAHTRYISFLASEWPTINFSFFMQNEVSTVCQRVSHWISAQEPSVSNTTCFRFPPTWCLLCDELYFFVMLMIHTNYNCYETITYLLIYALCLSRPMAGCCCWTSYIQLLPSLANTFQLQLLSWTKWLPTVELISWHPSSTNSS